MQYSSKYIIGFAAAVCLVCAVFVAGLAVALKPQQELNKNLDRKEKVLNVAGLLEEGVKKPADEIQALFEANIQARFIDLKTGEYLSDEQLAERGVTDPAKFDAKKYLGEHGTDVEKNLAGVPEVPDLAQVYEVKRGDGISSIILPVHGKGLWSTMYGYVAIANDGNTIKGLTFYEHGETPGLGGEVDNPRWKGLWPGRKVYGDEGEAQIMVVKGQAGPPEVAPYSVDGLSGATITSRGVGYLLQFWLGGHGDFKGYKPYIEKFGKGGAS